MWYSLCFLSFWDSHLALKRQELLVCSHNFVYKYWEDWVTKTVGLAEKAAEEEEEEEGVEDEDDERKKYEIYPNSTWLSILLL